MVQEALHSGASVLSSVVEAMGHFRRTSAVMGEHCFSLRPVRLFHLVVKLLERFLRCFGAQLARQAGVEVRRRIDMRCKMLFGSPRRGLGDCRCPTLASARSRGMLAVEQLMKLAKETATAVALDARGASTDGGLADEHTSTGHREM